MILYYRGYKKWNENCYKLEILKVFSNNRKILFLFELQNQQSFELKKIVYTNKVNLNKFIVDQKGTFNYLSLRNNYVSTNKSIVPFIVVYILFLVVIVY